jgi:hypothetical protein
MKAFFARSNRMKFGGVAPQPGLGLQGWSWTGPSEPTGRLPCDFSFRDQDHAVHQGISCDWTIFSPPALEDILERR